MGEGGGTSSRNNNREFTKHTHKLHVWLESNETLCIMALYCFFLFLLLLKNQIPFYGSIFFVKVQCFKFELSIRNFGLFVIKQNKKK